VSWLQTQEIYLQKARDVMRGVVLLPEAPRHVPVLCLDLEYMLQQLADYESTIIALRAQRQPGQLGGLEGRDKAMGRLYAALRGVEGALADLPPHRVETLEPARRQLVEGLRHVIDRYFQRTADR
jgi:hypothetical protein